MQRFLSVKWAASFWGFATFFAIGFNYVAFTLLAIALLSDSARYHERWGRLRASANWWPACFFVAWTVLVLIFRPHYPETLNNAAHSLRIVLTLAFALTLARTELIGALRGFFLALIVSLLIIGLSRIVQLPHFALWGSITTYGGNKSIATSLLMALALISGLLLLPSLTPLRKIAAAIVMLAIVPSLVMVLPSRTAWLIVAAGIAIAVLRWPHRHRVHQTVLFASAVVVVLAVGMSITGVRNHVSQGISSIERASQNPSNAGPGSWGIRYRLYTETAKIALEQPWAGWGIGSWDTLWKERVPDEGELSKMTTPHDDFLWMGTQAGVPGAIALFLLIIAGLPRAWRRRDASGSLASVALVAALFASTFNAALRDAAIGLCFWFVALVYQRMSSEPGSAWREVFTFNRPRGSPARDHQEVAESVPLRAAEPRG